MVPYGRCSSGDVREHDDTRRTVCNPLQDGDGLFARFHIWDSVCIVIQRGYKVIDTYTSGFYA